MIHNIITTENYLLVVDDSEIKAGDLVIENQELNQIFQVQDINKVNGLCRSKVDTYVIDSCKKITAHLPLNNSPILEGVDLLPPLEDEVEKLAKEWNDKGEFTSPYSFKAGYNKFKEKYKYTAEDMCNFIEFVRNNYTGFGSPNLIYNKGGQEKTAQIFDRYVVAFQQPKMPVGFKCEIEAMNIDEIREQGKGFLNTNTKKSKITTNPQGLTQWVGEYIY